MTLAHLIYIPALILLGMVFGYILAGRTAKNAEADRIALAKKRQAQTARHKQELEKTPPTLSS